MSLYLLADDEITDFVMPAWIAGIQIRKDACGDIRVDLDSSTPCGNDAIKEALFEVAEVPSPRTFEGRRKDHEVYK